MCEAAIWRPELWQGTWILMNYRLKPKPGLYGPVLNRRAGQIIVEIISLRTRRDVLEMRPNFEKGVVLRVQQRLVSRTMPRKNMNLPYFVHMH